MNVRCYDPSCHRPGFGRVKSYWVWFHLLGRSSGLITTSYCGPFPEGLPDYSFFSRREPSMRGCHPYTSVNMKLSMRRSVGPLSLTVDL